ncbi:MAG: hypothetical protein KatS3mg035_1238 [Bacteroidia bacterium]|nr:MAG: hypothetical protein KatS3mg035_1238 [Bacteroidia bacterium]
MSNFAIVILTMLKKYFLKRLKHHGSFLTYVWIIMLFSFRFLNAQNTLPVLEHHSLYESNHSLAFVWVNQRKLEGSWILEHSYNGLDWNILEQNFYQQYIFYYQLPKKLYGFIRLRWASYHDTTTIAIHNLNHTQKKGLFACYDYEHCKVAMGYQIHYETDLLLRFYNSVGEEIATHFLYYKPNDLYFWNFEPPFLKKDIYLVRLIDALSKEILFDFRLPILYDSFEKVSN